MLASTWVVPCFAALSQWPWSTLQLIFKRRFGEGSMNPHDEEYQPPQSVCIKVAYRGLLQTCNIFLKNLTKSKLTGNFLYGFPLEEKLILIIWNNKWGIMLIQFKLITCLYLEDLDLLIADWHPIWPGLNAVVLSYMGSFWQPSFLWGEGVKGWSKWGQWRHHNLYGLCIWVVHLYCVTPFKVVLLFCSREFVNILQKCL